VAGDQQPLLDLPNRSMQRGPFLHGGDRVTGRRVGRHRPQGRAARRRWRAAAAPEGLAPGARQTPPEPHADSFPVVRPARPVDAQSLPELRARPPEAEPGPTTIHPEACRSSPGTERADSAAPPDAAVAASGSRIDFARCSFEDLSHHRVAIPARRRPVTQSGWGVVSGWPSATVARMHTLESRIPILDRLDPDAAWST
jgi:hypothetical protein